MANKATKKSTKKGKKESDPKKHPFRNKLLLNQWIISLFGIDPLQEHSIRGEKVRPFHNLAESISTNLDLEGLTEEGIHRFYGAFVNSGLFWSETCELSKEQILIYEENIARHTERINKDRDRKIVWKYFQWLTLLFVEIYLDRFFCDKEKLLDDLNAYVQKFNEHFSEYENIAEYEQDDLNKICFQNATGSGKTLLMHVNLLQYLDYAQKFGLENQLSRTILITPNGSLSDQHETEFMTSGFSTGNYARDGETLFSKSNGRNHIDVLEITKLVDQKGPSTVATESLGEQNLLLVDEGHRGARTEDGVWFTQRSKLCAKGFTMEYSATFAQAVAKTKLEDNYAKSIIFDYSYRWFYEDGFGKEYDILNLSQGVKNADKGQAEDPKSLATYLVACLLKYYQQLHLYDENSRELRDFNSEKPLWVFVGSSVVKPSGDAEKKIEKQYASDVAKILRFFAVFVHNKNESIQLIENILSGNGASTGLLDENGVDIFDSAFIPLRQIGKTAEDIYSDILEQLFQYKAGGVLTLNRIKGDSGEIVMRLGNSETPFGLITVGDTKGLCDHLDELRQRESLHLILEESQFSDAMFNSVKDSRSPINLLIGAKKFIEGWDCWRVSTMGLMHVGKTEGAQIIQLFGRGIRLKGYNWSLKRSSSVHPPARPRNIGELETLNVFGIGSDFMEKFRNYLKEEGLPTDKKPEIHDIPLNVTYDFGKKLKVLRPKHKKTDGKEYSFKNDSPVPTLDANVPEYLIQHSAVSDWYPRIQSITTRQKSPEGQKYQAKLRTDHVALFNLDALYFELEIFKRSQSWHNLNITKEGIRKLLLRQDWYTLYLPEDHLQPKNFGDVHILQRVAAELLKRYCDKYYNYRKREFIEPRLELRELTRDDTNIPDENFYQLIVDGSETQMIEDIKTVQRELSERKKKKTKAGNLIAYNFDKHLFEPLLHLKQGSRIVIRPVSLNESEFQFVENLGDWCDANEDWLKNNKTELFLLRNMSRGKGVGFFEAGNFHPDFILWIIKGAKQYVNFIEPHGLVHEGPGSEKVLFHQKIKVVQQRLGDPNVSLSSFILSSTEYKYLQWDMTQEELESMNILFMKDAPERYVENLITRILF